MKTKNKLTREEVFQAALDKFTTQFDVKLKSTSFSNDYDKNDGIGEQEFWVKGLIETKASGLIIDVGGWFSHDTRDGGNNIYCLLAVTINGKDIGDCHGLQSWYDTKTETWEEIVWESY